MGLTLKDFRVLLLTNSASTKRNVIRLYGRCFYTKMLPWALARDCRNLSPAGVAEYHHLKATFAAGGRFAEHIPLIANTGTAGTLNKTPLYETLLSKRRSGTITAPERKTLLATARAGISAASVQREMTDIRKNGVMVFYRRVLQDVMEREDSQVEVKQLIAEALNVADMSLAELSLAGR